MIRRFFLLAILAIATVTVSFAQWQEASGISTATGHRLTAVVVHEGTIFFGTADGGLYKIVNDEFVPVRNGLPIGSIMSVLHDDANVLYVGVDGDGTYTSSDGGETWSRLDILGSVRDIETANGWLFLVTDRTFYRSIHGSGIFEQITNQGVDMMVTSVESDGTVVFAGDYFMVHRSTDFGTTWTTASLPDENHFSVGVGDMTITPSGLTAIAMRFRFISTDNGISFTAIEDEDEKMVNKAIADGDGIIAALADGLYTSTDGGRTMTLLLSDNGRWFEDVVKDGDKIVAITEHTIFVSEDNGAHWESITPVISAQAVSALAVSNNLVFAASDRLFRSSDDAHSFAPASTDTTSLALRDIQLGDSWLFALSGPATILRSRNNGESWEDISGPIGIEGIPIAAFHVDGSSIFAASYHYGLYYSHDNGITWSVTDDPNTVNILANPTALASFNDRIYLATQSYLVESADGGATWSVVTAAATEEPIMTMTGDDQFLYAATRDRTYRLSRTGTWTPGGSLAGTTVLLADYSEVYAGTAGTGVWFSSDYGGNWTRIGGTDELTGNAAVIYDLAFSGMSIIAATGSNVWTSPRPDMGVDELSPNLPRNLLAHYNRTDGTVHLSLSMPSAARADIELVDLRGVTVQQLSNERLEGTVEKSFAVDRLPAGMYFLTVRTDKGVSSVKLPIVAW